MEYLESSPQAARIFGLFYEDLLAAYFEDVKGYEVLAGKRVGGLVSRPTIWRRGATKRTLLADFVLRDSGGTYVVEAKCWPGFDARPLTPEIAERGLGSLLHLELAEHVCRFAGQEYAVDGWGVAWWTVDFGAWSDSDRQRLHLRELCAIRSIWEDPDTRAALLASTGYQEVVARWRGVCNDLFDALTRP
jgi:hypothetical protein